MSQPKLFPIEFGKIQILSAFDPPHFDILKFNVTNSLQFPYADFCLGISTERCYKRILLAIIDYLLQQWCFSFIIDVWNLLPVHKILNPDQ